MFRYQEALDKHATICETLKVFGTVYKMPKKSHLGFDQWAKTIPPKFIVYADFESVLELPQLDDDGASVHPTSTLQVHLPIAAGSLTLGPDGGNGAYHEFYGANCAV